MAYPWYAVRVRSNFEKIASNALHQLGYEGFTPFYRTKRRWSDRTKVIEAPLFPGYVFCRFDPERRLPILQTTGVVSIVSFGKEPAAVDESELDAIRRAMIDGRHVQPWPYLKVGRRVRLLGGAFHGAEGQLVQLKDKRQRVVLSISLLQRAVAFEIDRENIEPIL